MEPSIYLPALSILANVAVGFILYRQIKSQKEIIENYKTYIETLDIKRFKDYIETAESLNEKKLIIESEKMQIDLESYKDKSARKYAAQSTELTMLIAYFINSNKDVKKEEKLDFIRYSLPLTGHILSKIIK